MNAVEKIVADALATVKTFEAHVEQHADLVKGYLERKEAGEVGYGSWLDSLSVADDLALGVYEALRVKADAARKTLKVWGAEA